MRSRAFCSARRSASTSVTSMDQVYPISAPVFGSDVRFGAGRGRSTTVTFVTIGTVMRSRLDTRSDEYRENLAAMQ